MPQLIKQSSDTWSLANDEAPVEWQSEDSWQAGQPLLLAGDAEPDPAHAQASKIAIEFPAFNDGRGLSLAVLLRTRMGYTGELRAVGAVHEDILHYMIRCGFDSFELPDDRDSAVALAGLQPYSDHYQGSAINPQPAFRRVNR